jgi:hypothetical protein
VIATDLPDLIRRLACNPQVIGIARYGGRSPRDTSLGGDFDIFVVVRERPVDLESVHFHCGGIPVDMNLRTMEDLRRDEPLTEIDHTVATAEILYDPTGTIAAVREDIGARWKPEASRLTEHEVGMNRFCQQHALDKVRHRLDTEPLLSELLLATNVYWLLMTYFRVRSRPYPGEKEALRIIGDEEPAAHALMAAFYDATDRGEKLRISEELTELVLRPIGGPWREGETISFGTHTDAVDLNETGEAFLRELLDSE